MEQTKKDVSPKPSIVPTANLAKEHDYPVAQLLKIQFGLLSSKDAVRLSVIKETDGRSRKVGITKWQDLFDARMGVPNIDEKCKTCNGTRRGACDAPRGCDGHFGHIALPFHVYHPHYIRKCVKILSSICLGCSRVLDKKKRRNVLDAIFEETSDEDADSGTSAFEKSASKGKVGARTSVVASRKRKRAETESNFAKMLMRGLEHGATKQEWTDSHALASSTPEFQARACKLEPTEIADQPLAGCVPERLVTVPKIPGPKNDGQSMLCKYCNGPDGSGFKIPKVKLKLVGRVVGTRGKVDTIKLVVDEKSGDLPSGFWDFVGGHPTNNADKTRTLLSSEAFKMLRRIPKADIPKLDMDALVSRPEAFIMMSLLISPNCNRLVMEDWSSTSQPRVLLRRSSQSNKLDAIVRKAKQVRDSNRSGQKADFSDAEQDSQELQLLIARHFRACKVVEYKLMNGQEVEESGGRLELKWLKANVLAKRSNHSARSIINGDPWIKIEEIGIPAEMAQRLTVDEKVNALNIRKWQKCVDDYLGASNVSLPGAFVVKKRKEAHSRDLEILRRRKSGKDQLTFRLNHGDTITRSLRDGDRVFANRPPSLHKHSLVTLKVKVHPLSTIAISPLICPPFDADFDGDAFHIFVPQSCESKAENEELMTVPAQMICPQGGQPLIGLTQDTLVAGHLLTSGHVFINRETMQQLSMSCSSALPIPAIVKANTSSGPLWTGKQLFTMTLPVGLAFGNLSWNGSLLGKPGPTKPIYGSEGDVLIQDGELLISQGGARWLERSPNGVVRAVCDHAGPVATMEHLDCLQAVLHQWFLTRGFSVGLNDFYAARDPVERKRMLQGVQRSLQKSNEASLKQALILDRQVLHRILSPRHGGVSGCGEVDEHEGCFGLLLGDSRKNSQRIAVLQGAAIERFQGLAPDIENLVLGYMDQDNSLLAMKESGSKGSSGKVTQQVGTLGLQLYKGEKMLPLRQCNKLSYIQKDKSNVFLQMADPFLEGYWESWGIIKSSYLDGLNPTELFMDSLVTRCNVMRQGIEEPNQILKNLMLFMRDMKIEYDGTVRVGSSKSVVQFEYGMDKGCPLNTHPSGLSKAPLVSEDPDDLWDRWPDSNVAGEPVGVLAATAIAEPAYSVKMQSVHRTQVLGTGPVQLLKEVLTVRSKTKLKVNDRRSILRFPQNFGRERRALEIQTKLQKVSLEKITLATAIIFMKLDDKLFAKIVDEKEVIPKPFRRLSPWLGHIQICKRTVDENKLDMDAIVGLLNRKHTGKSLEGSASIYFLYSDKCISKVHPQCKGLCIWFFPIIPVELVATMTREAYSEKTTLLLESMKTIMLPAVLNTTIRGSDNIENVKIFWEDSGSASRLPLERSALRQHSLHQTKRPDRGELAIEVVVKAPKGTGKRGATWQTVKEACIHVMDMIDWRRSSPFAIQEMYTSFGIEAAHQIILKRLTLAIKNMGKPVLPKHMMLVADTMTQCGGVIGLGSAGYRDFCRQLSISTPFTEAAVQQPKKAFLDAAAGGAMESIDGALTSAVWGSRVPLGTGTGFQIKPQGINVKGDPLDLWGQLLKNPKAAHIKRKLKATTREVFPFEKFIESLSAFQKCRLAGSTFPGDIGKAPIFQYGNEDGREDVPKKGEGKTLGPVIEITFPHAKQAEDELMPEKEKHLKRRTSLENNEHGGRNRTAEKMEDGKTPPAMEGDIQTRCKRNLESLEGEQQLLGEPVSKLQKINAGLRIPQVEADIAVLRFNDTRRVTWLKPGRLDVEVAEELKGDFLYHDCNMPRVSSKEVLVENRALALDADSQESIAFTNDKLSQEKTGLANFKGSRSTEAAIISLSSPDVSKESGDISLVPGSKAYWPGGVTNIVRNAFRALFPMPRKNDQDIRLQEVEEQSYFSHSGEGDPEQIGETAMEGFHDILDQESTQLSPKRNDDTGSMQLEVASNEFEQLTIDKKELQSLVQVRFADPLFVHNMPQKFRNDY